MNNYISVKDVDHKVDRLYVHWDMHTVCQLKCSYCFAQVVYKDSWCRIPSQKVFDAILEALDRATLPLFIGLQGGEPTLTPRYFEILKRISEIIGKNDKSRCYITSNGVRDPVWWKQHPYHKNFYMLWSFHPENAFDKRGNFSTYVDDFVDNVTTMVDKGFKTKINLMLHPNKKYWNIIELVRKQLPKHTDKFEIHPHYLYADGDMTRLYPYSDEFWNYWKHLKDITYAQYEYKKEDGSIDILNEYSIFKNKLTCFKDWTCNNNNYEVHMNGDVLRFCCNEKDSLITNPDFFANIKEVSPITCKSDNCNCDGMLKVHKHRTLYGR